MNDTTTKRRHLKITARGPSVKNCAGCEDLVKVKYEKFSYTRGLYTSYRLVCRIYNNSEPRFIPWCPLGLYAELKNL
jgi:hypothetical protein